MKLPTMPAPFSAQKSQPAPALKPVLADPPKRVVKTMPLDVKSTSTVAPRVPEPEAKPRQDSEGLVTDALSYLYAKSIAQVSKETGLPKAKVKKEIDSLYDRDYLDEKNGFYRYQNTAPWKVSAVN